MLKSYLSGLKKNSSFNYQTIALISLCLWHIIGVIGLNSKYSELFIKLTPLNLIVSTIIVFSFHSKPFLRLFTFIAIVYCLGFAVEVLGVQTGWPFGTYTYEHALGPKLFGVPLLIGVNWALLIYCTGAISAKINKPIWAKVIVGAGLMVLIDLPLEVIAPIYKFWVWETAAPPLENFVAWFAISSALQLIFIKLINKTRNPVAPIYYVVVLIFFSILLLLNK